MFDLQGKMMSGVRAGLVSADVLRREQQELRKQERSSKHLEGKGLKPLHKHELFLCFQLPVNAVLGLVLEGWLLGC